MTQSPVILGLWPLAGITTVGVTESDAKATMAAALEHGITRFDTAFSYGYQGQSDQLLGSFVRGKRERYQLIGKVGQRWAADRKRIVDGSPHTLVADAEQSLRRMGLEHFNILMLHCPDPEVPIEQSAEALVGLQRRGLCERIGVCNVDADQQRRFSLAAPCDAIQCPLNLIQRSSQHALIPQCRQADCEVYVFWVLMKGLLAGRITRDYQFPSGDPRPSYDIFQGAARTRAHDIVDELGKLALASGRTIAQLSIGWALSQQGVSAALVGARRADQVTEIAAAQRLASDVVDAIEKIVQRVCD